MQTTDASTATSTAPLAALSTKEDDEEEEANGVVAEAMMQRLNACQSKSMNFVTSRWDKKDSTNVVFAFIFDGKIDGRSAKDVAKTAADDLERLYSAIDQLDPVFKGCWEQSGTQCLKQTVHHAIPTSIVLFAHNTSSAATATATTTTATTTTATATATTTATATATTTDTATATVAKSCPCRAYPLAARLGNVLWRAGDDVKMAHRFDNNLAVMSVLKSLRPNAPRSLDGRFLDPIVRFLFMAMAPDGGQSSILYAPFIEERPDDNTQKLDAGPSGQIVCFQSHCIPKTNASTSAAGASTQATSQETH